MASFDGATFKQRVYSIPLETSANVSVRHIPGSDTNYIDIGGNNSNRLTITARFDTDAERVALAAKVGKPAATLIYLDGTVSAVLASMRRSTRYPNDTQIADLEFVIVG